MQPPRQKTVRALSTCETPVTPSQCSTSSALSGRPSTRAQTTIIRGTSSATPPTRQDCRQASPPADPRQRRSHADPIGLEIPRIRRCCLRVLLRPSVQQEVSMPSVLASWQYSTQDPAKKINTNAQKYPWCYAADGCAMM